MKKFNLLSAIGSAVICGVCALAFNDSFSTNRTIGYNSNVGYYNGDTFNYVNMNSRGILNSNMYNPNGL